MRARFESGLCCVGLAVRAVKAWLLKFERRKVGPVPSGLVPTQDGETRAMLPERRFLLERSRAVTELLLFIPPFVLGLSAACHQDQGEEKLVTAHEPVHKMVVRGKERFRRTPLFVPEGVQREGCWAHH